MVDFKLDENGELVIENGDFVYVAGDEAYAQQVIFRLKTQRGDWMLSPNVGASLEQFIGAPNTRTTHYAIENRVYNALTYDNLFIDPKVSCVPLTENEVFILVQFGSVEDNTRTIQIQGVLDLRKGLVFSRSAVQQH